MKNGKFYNTKLPNYLTDYVTIHLSNRKTTSFHEIGHYVEYFNPNALRISKEFIAKRTKGENSVKLSSLFVGSGYKANEISKADDFITPYIGKEYANASEVLSIGLESIFEPLVNGQLKRITIVNGKQKYEYAKIQDNEE